MSPAAISVSVPRAPEVTPTFKAARELQPRLNAGQILTVLASLPASPQCASIPVPPYPVERMPSVYQRTMLPGVDVDLDSRRMIKENVPQCVRMLSVD